MSLKYKLPIIAIVVWTLMFAIWFSIPEHRNPPSKINLGIDEPYFSHYKGPKGKAFSPALIIVNQVANSMIPEAPIRLAVESWGLQYIYDGVANCPAQVGNVVYVCVTEIINQLCPRAHSCWSFAYDTGGIVLDPILIGPRLWRVQEAVCHEIGNVEGFPEQSPNAHNCMAMSMNGSVNPPSH